MQGRKTTTHSPVPKSRTIRGGPSNAMNITVMRPFSRKWLIVSFPAQQISETALAIDRQIQQYGVHSIMMQAFRAYCIGLTTPCQILIPHPGRTLNVEAVVRALGRDVDVPVRLQRRRRDPEEVLLLDPLEQVGRAGVEEDDHTPNFAYLGLCLMWYEFLGAFRCEATLVWFVGRA